MVYGTSALSKLIQLLQRVAGLVEAYIAVQHAPPCSGLGPQPRNCNFRIPASPEGPHGHPTPHPEHYCHLLGVQAEPAASYKAGSPGAHSPRGVAD